MGETKTQVEFPEAVRRKLEAAAQQLEAYAVVEGDRNFLVLVYRVDYGGRPMPESPPRVVRFSRSEHSIRVATRIVLSSPSYYRELEEKSVPPEGQSREGRRERRPERETRGAGVGDKMEARYRKRYDLGEFHRRFAPALVNFPVSGSAKLTYETGGFWILCTSVEPGTSQGFERLRREFAQYDCATIITDPSEFALQLGKDFGHQHGEEAVSSDAVATLRLAKIALGFIKAGAPVPEAVVVVRHGHVVYSDEPANIIERYPERFRSVVLPFVKRTKFAKEKEYRFTVSLGGEPKRQRIWVDVSDKLRCLAAPYAKGDVERGLGPVTGVDCQR